MRFKLAMDHVSIGMSFRQAAAAIQGARDHTKTATLSDMNDLIIGQYVRVLVSGNLQDISDLMGDLSVWAFSLAFDSSTHFEQSFFDLRIRICFKGRLCNLHLVGLPLFDRHTAEILYNLLCKFLDALYPDWRIKLLNVSSNGENTMTGCHAGLVTRITRCAEFNVLRIRSTSSSSRQLKVSTAAPMSRTSIRFSFICGGSTI